MHKEWLSLLDDRDVSWGSLLVELELTGKLPTRVAQWEAVLCGSGRSHLPGRGCTSCWEIVHEGGMLESSPKGGSALVCLAEKFWEKPPVGLVPCQGPCRKPAWGVVLLKLPGGESSGYSVLS